MSDLRTELFTKVVPKMKANMQPQDLNNLTFDDPDEPEVPATETLSKVEQLFNWIKDHPACTYADICKAFDGKIAGTYIASKLVSFYDRKIIHKAMSSTSRLNIYSAAMDTYPRLDRKAQVARMFEGRAALGKEEITRRIQAGHAAKHAEQKVVKKKIVLVKREGAPAPAVQVTPVDLNTLSIVQARKLYDELKQIFGA